MSTVGQTFCAQHLHSYMLGPCIQCVNGGGATLPSHLIDSAELSQLRAENAKLRAEIESLKPKPVVSTYEWAVRENTSTEMNAINGKNVYKMHGDTNLKMTFHDGVLVSAKVKNAQGEWE